MTNEFENRYEITDTISKEYFRYFFFKKPVNIFYDTLYLLFILYGIYMIINNSSIFGLFLIAVPLVAIGGNAYKYIAAVKKNSAALKNRKSLITVRITDDYIEASNAKGESNRLNAKDIISYSESENLAFIGVNNLYMIIKKDGFVKGDIQSLKLFIRNKITENKRDRKSFGKR